MNYSLRRNIAHLGTILFRLSFIGLFLILALLFSQILVLVVYVVLIVIGLISLCTLFFVEDFRKLFDVTNSFQDFLNRSNTYIPMVAGISLVFIGLAFVFMLPNYKDRKTRIHLILCALLFVLVIVLLVIGGRGGGVHA
ncbi:MAG: hypothetical protein K2N64_06010 [Anaeroplasmataceae bacterium]|nr:hypothetical protein [Anaeroplasmataceae bacterium]